MMDALLEGFDTGVPWMSFIHAYFVRLALHSVCVCVSEADSARHVVSMGQLFSNLRLPGGGKVLSGPW